jgi:hypothetical protein
MSRKIYIILNEFSLHGQYKTEKEFYNNILHISEIVNYVKVVSTEIKDVEIILKKHNSILNKSLIITDMASFEYKQINCLKDSANKVGITTLLKNFLAISTTTSKIILSPCTSIIYEKCSYVDALEGNSKDFYLFLSFNDSFFKNSMIQIYKDDMSDFRNIYFIDSIDYLKEIINENFYLVNKISSPKNIPNENTPNDKQTFLRYTNEFVKTQYTNHGRAVYYNNSSSCYYVVDNAHKQGSAEIEIFDSSKNHIGTSLSLENWNLNTLTKVAGRSFNQ